MTQFEFSCQKSSFKENPSNQSSIISIFWWFLIRVTKTWQKYCQISMTQNIRKNPSIHMAMWFDGKIFQPGLFLKSKWNESKKQCFIFKLMILMVHFSYCALHQNAFGFGKIHTVPPNHPMQNHLFHLGHNHDSKISQVHPNMKVNLGNHQKSAE